MTNTREFKYVFNQVNKRLNFENSHQQSLYETDKRDLMAKYHIDTISESGDYPIGFIAENYDLQTKKLEMIKSQFSKTENDNFIHLISLCIPIFEKYISIKEKQQKNKKKTITNDENKLSRNLILMNTLINDMYLLLSIYKEA